MLLISAEEGMGKEPSAANEVLILLHGLGVNSWLMSLLARRLHKVGRRTLNWGYASFGQSLDQLIPELKTRFQELQATLPADATVHIVAHSLGAILTRAALAEVDLPQLRRVVLLSPPNHGSHVATWLGPYVRWLLPLVDELSDRENSPVNRLEGYFRPGVEVGVIAASWDYVLHIESTHLEGEVDHITLQSRHSGLVLRRRVAIQIEHFLQHGAFDHRAEAASSLTASPDPSAAVSE